MKKTLISLFTIIASFVVLFASCNLETSSTKVEYKVSHYIQNAADDEYTLYDTESFKGFVGEAATAEPLALDGFSALSFEKPKIKKGLNITIKYDRKTVRNTFNFDGGTVTNLDGTVIESVTLTGRYGAEINFPKPEKKGYVLEAWYDADGNEAPSTFTNDNSFIAGYVTKTQANYTVHHFFQNIENDDYTEDETLKQTLDGTTGTNTQAVAKEITGFTALSFNQQIVQADNSTHINIYYNRNLVTFTFNLAGGKGTESLTKKYGTTVAVPDPIKEGSIKFSGWNPVLPQTFTQDSSFTAVYGLPSYKVKYLFENLNDDGFSSDSAYPDESYIGTVGETTVVKAKNITGFIPQEITQKVINEDSSTVVEVKYNRKIITLYIKLNNATGTGYIQGKYCKESEKEEGKALVASKLASLNTNVTKPTRTGFTFNGYDYSETPDLYFSTDYDETCKIDTKWAGGIPSYYSVKIYQEKINYNSENDKYNLLETKTYQGNSGEVTNILKDGNDKIKIEGANISYSGFEVSSLDKNKTIEGDETTTINVYFDRKIITYTCNLNGGKFNGKTDNVEIKGRFGENVGFPNSVRTGYSISKWEYEDDASTPVTTFLADNKNIDAHWTGKTISVTYHNGEQTNTLNKEYGSDFETAVASITETGRTLGGWSRKSDYSTVDFFVGKKFEVSEDEIENLISKGINLYALWNADYIVKHYKENDSGVFELVVDDTENKTYPYTSTGEVPDPAKKYEGYNDYKSKPVISYDNTTVIPKFYTKSTLSDSVANKIEDIDITDKNDKKYAYLYKLNITASTENIQLIYAYDENTYNITPMSEGVHITDGQSVKVVGVKDGMYCSDLVQSGPYETYYGTKTPEEKNEVLDIIFNDNSATPCCLIDSLNQNQKNNVKEIVFYVGTESDDLGARTLAVCVNNINSYNARFFVTTDGGKVSPYKYVTIASKYKINNFYGDENLKDGSEMLNKYNNASFTEKERYEGYATLNKRYAGYYIPSLKEALEFYYKSNDINQMLPKLNRGSFFAGGKVYMTCYYYTNSNMDTYCAGINSNGRSDVCFDYLNGNMTILPIRRIDNTAQ